MTKRNQQKRNHHKQPIHFLKGFASPVAKSKYPDIWVYEKKRPWLLGDNPKLASIKHVGFGRDFYSVTNLDGTPNTTEIEDKLLSQFEEPAVPILNKIRCKEKILQVEKDQFARYIASMMSRSDGGRKLAELALQIAVNEACVRVPNPPPDQVSELDALIKSGRLIVESALDTPDILAPILSDMRWTFYEATDDTLLFFTSDTPVRLMDMWTPSAELLFPISSTLILRGMLTKESDLEYVVADDLFVHYARRKMAEVVGSRAYFANQSESLLSLLRSTP